MRSGLVHRSPSKNTWFSPPRGGPCFSISRTSMCWAKSVIDSSGRSALAQQDLLGDCAVEIHTFCLRDKIFSVPLLAFTSSLRCSGRCFVSVTATPALVFSPREAAAAGVSLSRLAKDDDRVQAEDVHVHGQAPEEAGAGTRRWPASSRGGGLLDAEARAAALLGQGPRRASRPLPSPDGKVGREGLLPFASFRIGVALSH